MQQVLHRRPQMKRWTRLMSTPVKRIARGRDQMTTFGEPLGRALIYCVMPTLLRKDRKIQIRVCCRSGDSCWIAVSGRILRDAPEDTREIDENEVAHLPGAIFRRLCPHAVLLQNTVTVTAGRLHPKAASKSSGDGVRAVGAVCLILHVQPGNDTLPASAIHGLDGVHDWAPIFIPSDPKAAPMFVAQQ